MVLRKFLVHAAALTAAIVFLTSCGLKRHAYDNPINKDTQQPDKVLFDTAVNDIEHSRFERARLTLQTLMNTYDTSEYLAKAKLAVADSWYREGGAHGFAQAEAEYKDFILFYPTMEEAAEAQGKICKMQYNQMEKADRDKVHALRAEDECRQLLTQFPNSKFAPEAQQLMRGIQEVLADSEFKVGYFYHQKGSYASSANRMQGLADQFPLYSRADEALWDLADSYRRMGDRFENSQATALTRIVKDYPLSTHADEAKAKLKAMNRPVPEADPVAYSRMKYEQENRTSRGLVAKAWGPFSARPDMSGAAKAGTPQMTSFRPLVPQSVPPSAAGALATTNEVTAQTPADPSQLDKNPNELARPPANGTTPTPDANAAPAAPPVVLTRTNIDVNTAAESQLAQIFGKTTARKVMAYRPYTSLKDLVRAGISQKTIDRLTPSLAPVDKSDK
jgi:outer membrane protein assembly factor BamD